MKASTVLRRALAVLLLIVLIVPAIPACAESVKKGSAYIVSNTAGVYKSKSTDSKKLATVSLGQKLTCVSVSGSWAKVKNTAGDVGYMKKSTLSNKNPNDYKKTIYVQRDDLKVRKNASTASKVIAKLDLGSSWYAVAKSGDGKWLRIKSGKKYGYIQAAYTDTAKYKKGTKVYVIDDTAALASGAGEFDSVGSIYLGQYCYKLKTSGDYVKVRTTGGKVGWCLKSQVSTENPNKYSDTLYLRYAGKLLFEKPGVASTKISTAKNAKVTFVAMDKDGRWSRVKYKNKYYYVCPLFTDGSKNGSGKIELFAKTSTSLYKKASTTSKVLDSVRTGESVYMTGAYGRFAKVVTEDGKTGYIPAHELIEPFSF